jgi:hypothetical protein
MSLINFYKRSENENENENENEKIKCAIDFSQSLKIHGIRASSDETKLQFCSDAVEAITSVIIKSKVKNARLKNVKSKNIKVKNAGSLLNREEIDFIQNLNFSDVNHNVGPESDATDNKSQGKFYGT